MSEVIWIHIQLLEVTRNLLKSSMVFEMFGSHWKILKLEIGAQLYTRSVELSTPRLQYESPEVELCYLDPSIWRITCYTTELAKNIHNLMGFDGNSFFGSKY